MVDAADQERVADDLQGVLVERCYCFDPIWAVMELMKEQPEEWDGMTPPVPPVEYECDDEVGEKPAEWGGGIEVEESCLSEPLVPGVFPCYYDAELKEVYDEYSYPPTFNMRKLLVGNHPFENDKTQPNYYNGNQHEGGDDREKPLKAIVR